MPTLCSSYLTSNLSISVCANRVSLRPRDFRETHPGQILLPPDVVELIRQIEHVENLEQPNQGDSPSTLKENVGGSFYRLRVSPTPPGSTRAAGDARAPQRQFAGNSVALFSDIILPIIGDYRPLAAIYYRLK